MTAWIVRVGSSSWDGVDDQRLEEILAGIAKLRPTSWTVTLEREDPKPRTPRTDPDGDLLCPDCPRLFVSQQALRVHRARTHKPKEASS